MAELENNKKKETELRDYLIGRVMDEIPYTRLNGHRTNRLSNNANFAFQFIEGESLLIMLDMDGICGSSGSACTSGSLDPSHVLLAIGLPHEIAHGSLRLTLSEETTKEEIDHTVDCLLRRSWRSFAQCPHSMRISLRRTESKRKNNVFRESNGPFPAPEKHGRN